LSPEPLFTPRLAKRYLENHAQIPISKTSVYRWLQSGELPARQFRRRYLIKLTDLQKFARACCADHYAHQPGETWAAEQIHALLKEAA
jgi:excisionase family DNA binding protein